MEPDCKIVYGQFTPPIFLTEKELKSQPALGKAVGMELRRRLASSDGPGYYEEHLNVDLAGGEIFQAQDTTPDGLSRSVWIVMRDRISGKLIMLSGQGGDLTPAVLEPPLMIPVGHFGIASGRQVFITKSLITVMSVE